MKMMEADDQLNTQKMSLSDCAKSINRVSSSEAADVGLPFVNC